MTAEERGQAVMEFIIGAGLVYGSDEPVVMTWSANAAEQIGAFIEELLTDLSAVRVADLSAGGKAD